MLKYWSTIWSSLKRAITEATIPSGTLDDSCARIASASAGASPTGTRGPQRPASRISDGPLGQSVLTTRVPQAIASARTFPNPSNIEDKTNTAEAFIYGNGLPTNP